MGGLVGCSAVPIKVMVVRAMMRVAACLEGGDENG